MAIKVRVKGNLLAEFKKANKLAVDRKKQELVRKLAEATPKDTGEAAAGWRVEGDSIVNDVEHIEQLNQGSSKQAPAHFVEATLLSDKAVKPNGSIVRTPAR